MAFVRLDDTYKVLRRSQSNFAITALLADQMTKLAERVSAFLPSLVAPHDIDELLAAKFERLKMLIGSVKSRRSGESISSATLRGSHNARPRI